MRWRSPPELSHREALLRVCDRRPVCWICGFEIDLDAKADSHEAFSIDHVVPRCDGGAQMGFRNLKPAHRLCNSFRSNGRGPQPEWKERNYKKVSRATRTSTRPCSKIISA
jgi:hypothetical protein